MLVSTKGRYALRTMLDLAMYEAGEPVKIKDISARQDISVKYLEQIISILSKAGLVKSVRGSQGGYYLTKSVSEYTVGMILRAAEGSMAPVDCLPDDKNQFNHASEGVTMRIWQELDVAIKGVIDQYTLEELLDWQKEVQIDYVI